MTPLARRATTALTSLLLTSAGVAATGVVGSPAHAAPVAVTDATFTWDLNNESTSGAYAPGTWNLFSAGRLGDPGRSTTLTSGDSGATWSNGRTAGWKAVDGNVTVEDLQATGDYAPATFAGTRTNTAGVNANTANPPVRGETRLSFGAGTGTLDPAADDATITWDGDATVVYYSGYSFFYLSDPELSLTGGDGTVTATLGGYGADMNSPETWVPLSETEVTIADITDADVTSAGVVATPTYRGVTVTGVDPAQTASGTANHGSFPQSFVSFQKQVGTASYWYSSGGGADARKPTNPFTVTVGEPPAPASSTTTVSAPARTYGQAAAAVVTVTSAGATTGTVTLRSGSTTLGSGAVTNGRATIALGRPAARTYPLTATFSGNDTTASSTGTGSLRVAKAATSTSTTLTRPTTKKAGKLKVVVASSTTSPTGTVKVVVKRGSTTIKAATPSLNGRTATVTLPKGRKAAYAVIVTYAGNANVGASSRTTSYKITR